MQEDSGRKAEGERMGTTVTQAGDSKISHAPADPAASASTAGTSSSVPFAAVQLPLAAQAAKGLVPVPQASGEVPPSPEALEVATASSGGVALMDPTQPLMVDPSLPPIGAKNGSAGSSPKESVSSNPGGDDSGASSSQKSSGSVSRKSSLHNPNPSPPPPPPPQAPLPHNPRHRPPPPPVGHPQHPPPPPPSHPHGLHMLPPPLRQGPPGMVGGHPPHHGAGAAPHFIPRGPPMGLHPRHPAGLPPTSQAPFGVSSRYPGPHQHPPLPPPPPSLPPPPSMAEARRHRAYPEDPLAYAEEGLEEERYYPEEGAAAYPGPSRPFRRTSGTLRISKWVNPIPSDPDDGQQQAGEQELATKMLQIQSKRFYIDVKQNRRGRFMKIAEIGADGRRNQVFLALSTAAEFRDHLSLFSDFYANLGPPNPDTLPEDGKLKSETMVKDNRRYYLDLKENSRGRFLRVSQTIARGGPRCQIAIPAQGMIEFRDALQELLDEFGTDDGGYKGELPEGRHMRVENKNFYFDIGQNNRGIYMRISEVKTNFRTAITIPEKSWARFRDIFADYVDKMKDGGEKGPSESNK